MRRRRTRWRFGSYAAVSLYFIAWGLVGIAMAVVTAVSGEWTDAPLFVGMGALGMWPGVLVRSRNYVEVTDELVRVVVSGRQFNTTNDVSFQLPFDPQMALPTSLYCQEGDRTIRLGLLSQNQLRTPPAMRRFTRALNEAQVEWRWF